MARHLSVEKRKRQSDKANLRNRMVKSKLKTAQKKLESLIEKKDIESISAIYNEYVSLVDKAASGGVVHRNNASRKKANMAKKINRLTSSQQSEQKSSEKSEQKSEPAENQSGGHYREPQGIPNKPGFGKFPQPGTEPAEPVAWIA